MACPAFGSTSEVKLYYAVDPDPSILLSNDATFGSQAWKAIRMTGESLDLSITTTTSEEITQNRSYSDSVPTQGEVAGSFNFELSYDTYENFMIAALQDDTAIDSWTTGNSIQNASTKKCLMFLKVVTVGSRTDYFAYRGCQVNTMSFSVSPGAIITGEVGLTGIGGETYNDTDDSGVMDGWTFGNPTSTPLYSSVDGLKAAFVLGTVESNISAVTEGATTAITVASGTGFAVGQYVTVLTDGASTGDAAWNTAMENKYHLVTDVTGNVVTVSTTTTGSNWSSGGQLAVGYPSTFQDISFNMDNQIRQQTAVGTGSIFAAGTGSGRFMASASTTMYYSDYAIYEALVGNTAVRLRFEFEDSATAGTNGNKYLMEMDYCKVQSGAVPLAGGPDQDLLISPEFRAFEDSTNGTMLITKTDAA